MSLDVAAIQTILRAEGLDGWLLYDFHGSNPIASHLAGLDGGGHMTTRRWYYLIPATGDPRGLVHAIERHNLTRCRRVLSPDAARRGLAPGASRVAMGARNGAIMPVAIDAGTAGDPRAGVEIVSSGDLDARPRGRTRQLRPTWRPAFLRIRIARACSRGTATAPVLATCNR
jgi:hypothetical protein